MKTLDFNFELVGLDGSKAAHAGELLAGLLMSQTKGDSVKLFDWALSIQKREVITVDDSDFNKIKELITSNESLTVLAKAPLLKYLATIK